MTQQWKPIDSAPKDGTAIWAIGQLYGKPFQYECEWNGAQWYHGFGVGWESLEPSHWMPLPAAPCQTCNGHGMVGGLTPHSGYDAEPCPDCTPPASAQDDAKDEQPVAKVRRGHYGGRVGNIGFQEAVLLPGVKVMDNTLLYAHPAPAAGDARAEVDRLKGVLLGIRHRIGQHELFSAIKEIDAALAASQQQEG